MPTLGVLTHPRHRGRGLARAVVAAAAQAGLGRRAVVQYRAWRANAASIAVARRTGFVHYCDGVVIDLDDQPRPLTGRSPTRASRPELAC